MAIVDKLDIRRAQVLVEAIIVEVIVDKTAEFGVSWALEGSSASNAPMARRYRQISLPMLVPTAC